MEYEEIRDTRNTRNPYSQRLGIWVEEIAQGYARVVKTVEADDLNPVGVPHGGVYFSLADTAAGSAMASHGYLAVTVNATYNFLRGGKEGDVLTGEAREIKGGRSLSTFDVRISNQEGVLLGTGTFTFYRLDQKIQ